MASMYSIHRTHELQQQNTKMCQICTMSDENEELLFCGFILQPYLATSTNKGFFGILTNLLRDAAWPTENRFWMAIRNVVQIHKFLNKDSLFTIAIVTASQEQINTILYYWTFLVA